jgi:hypothetical protein
MGTMEIPQGPYRSLLQRYPTHDAWMAPEPEDMALLVLRELAVGSCQISLHNMAATMRERYYQHWGAEHTPNRLRVLAEAYAWLKTAGLLVQDPTQDDFDLVSRRGAAMTEETFAEFRAARRTGYDILDRRIAEKVWTIYLRGDFDIAIGYAFKVMEAVVRTALTFPEVGVTYADNDRECGLDLAESRDIRRSLAAPRYGSTACARPRGRSRRNGRSPGSGLGRH